jgi:ankyrin repeat protein
MNRLLEAVELNDYETFATLARSPSLDPRYLTLILDEGETLIH